MRITEKAHELIRQVVGPGDTVVDATLGNGYDTAFLADLVGRKGTVYGFDIQAKAIENARQRLSDEAAGGAPATIELLLCGHQRMAEIVDGPVRVVMFNLGFMPGGNKSVITKPESTVAALEAALELLAPGGIATVVIYTGHEGGAEEKEAVLACCAELPTEEFTAAMYESEEQAKKPPILVVVEKSGG
ncbi:MAG: class I SAM-dependent methyltransferase [Verrucomicrobiales bacterium]